MPEATATTNVRDSRTLIRVDTLDPPSPGFLGEGHTAVEVIEPRRLDASDPFVLLMDDRIELPTRRQIGGAHPHAGLETVTLVLEGALSDRDEGDLEAGDLAWMTAGRGIIHSEAVEARRVRLLQFWLALPSSDRDLEPQFEVVKRASAPTVKGAGFSGRLYSGTSQGQTSSTRNRQPITLVDLTLEAGASFVQTLPSSYNGFFYVLEGSVSVSGVGVDAAQVGWLAPGSAGQVVLLAGPQGARLVLAAGQPTGEPLVQHGPFVGTSRADLAGMYQRFRDGEFVPLSRLRGEADRPSRQGLQNAGPPQD